MKHYTRANRNYPGESGLGPEMSPSQDGTPPPGGLASLLASSRTVSTLPGSPSLHVKGQNGACGLELCAFLLEEGVAVGSELSSARTLPEPALLLALDPLLFSPFGVEVNSGSI